MDRPKLLIIDDEPAIATLIKRIAEPCGFQAEATSNFAQFRHFVENDQPDVICLDLGMPDFDGIEMLGFLTARNCTCPLIIISGFDRRIISASDLGLAGR